MAGHRSPSPSPACSSSATPPPSSSAHMSLQLRQDLALLAHSDPATRRSSMEALKQFIEGELDSRSMAGFLEQVSGEAGKSTGGHAISLFAEVVRVHRDAAVPFIPRIMAAVLRALASSSGWANHGNNLHQACAKVVASVARYAIEPSSSFSRSSSATDVLDSLCQPLLGLLHSNVEPVAVGSATCLQAIVESENWKLATLELVHDVCSRSSISYVEKGKHSLAHMHLLRSLAKFSAGALQEHAASILKISNHILVVTGGNVPGCGSWQQRAAAAQLVGTIIGGCDHRLLASELIRTTKALEKCRLDKVATVRQAVGEALLAAKSLVLEVEHLLLLDDCSSTNSVSSSPSKSSLPEPRKRSVRKKNIPRAESCGSTITANDISLASQESHAVLDASSSSSSITSISTSALRSPLPSPSKKSTAKTGWSPPGKESPVRATSIIDKYVAEADSPNFLAHVRPSDFRENTSLVTKGDIRPDLSKSDDLSYLLYRNKSKVSKEEYGDELVMDTVNGHFATSDFQCNNSVPEDYVEVDTLSGDRRRKACINERDKFFEVPEKEVICNLDEERCETIPLSAETDNNVPEHIKMVVENNGTFHGWQQRKAPCYEMAKTGMSAEDFLIFSTPRRLVRSLQSVSSTPDSKCSPERDQGLDLDCETLSESGWSVRDNPIAGDQEYDSPRETSVNGQRDMLIRSMEGLPSTGLFCQSCSREESLARCSESPDRVGFATGNLSLHEASSNTLKSCCAIGLANGILCQRHKDLERSEEKKLSAGLPKSRDWSPCVSVLRKVHFYVEGFLFCTSILVVGFAIFIAILTCNSRRDDIHSLVPT